MAITVLRRLEGEAGGELDRAWAAENEAVGDGDAVGVAVAAVVGGDDGVAVIEDVVHVERESRRDAAELGVVAEAQGGGGLFAAVVFRVSDGAHVGLTGAGETATDGEALEVALAKGVIGEDIRGRLHQSGASASGDVVVERDLAVGEGGAQRGGGGGIDGEPGRGVPGGEVSGVVVALAGEGVDELGVGQAEARLETKLFRGIGGDLEFVAAHVERLGVVVGERAEQRVAGFAAGIGVVVPDAAETDLGAGDAVL